MIFKPPLYLPLRKGETFVNAFLVHGDIDQQEIFKGTLSGMGFKNVVNPAKGEQIEV